MIWVTEVGLELTFASHSSPRSHCGHRLSLKFLTLCTIGFISKWVHEGVWDGHVHTATFNMGNQRGPTVQHRGLCSKLCGSLDGRGLWPKWTLIQLLSRQGFYMCYSFNLHSNPLGYRLHGTVEKTGKSEIISSQSHGKSEAKLGFELGNLVPEPLRYSECGVMTGITGLSQEFSQESSSSGPPRVPWCRTSIWSHDP